MLSGSFCVEFRVFSSRFQNSFFCGLVLVCGVKNTCSSYAKPIDSMSTSIGFVGMCSPFFRIIFSLGPISKRDKKSAAVFSFPGMCAMVKLNCKAKSQVFYKGGGINFVWKNLVTNFCLL